MTEPIARQSAIALSSVMCRLSRQVHLRDRVNGARTTVWGPMLRRNTYHGRSYPTLGDWSGSPAEQRAAGGQTENACEDCTNERPCLRHGALLGAHDPRASSF